MTKSGRAAKPPLTVPSRRGSSGATEEPGFRGWGVFPFPPSNRLIITTTKGVYIWDVYGISEIFRSGSEGIVAAKKIASGREMLAVADSQVVVLHDISGGIQRSYRLKGSEGQVRLLKYAKESKDLFFTTTLQNSVQSYSLQYSKVLDPAHVHPSPPSVFAISCTSRFLLSTSPTPPTIHLTSLALRAPPVLLRPQFSSSAVVAAEFHPERESYFCLAFADGTAAVYDANHFYYIHGNDKRREENAAILGSGGEKAFIRGLHVGSLTKNAATEDGVTVEGYEAGTDPSGVRQRESGISAVAFVPGRKATVVTVGVDGRCCVVDFTQPTKHKAVLLKSWHIRRPATSLSIICSTKKAVIGQLDGNDYESTQRRDLPNNSYYIAVGRSDGKVLLFDLDGKARGEQALDDKGTRVIDVEWTQIDSGTVLPRQNNGSGNRRSHVEGKRKSLGSSPVAESRPLHMESPAMSFNMLDHSEDPLFDFSTPRKMLGAFHWEPPSDESTVAAAIPREGVRGGKVIVPADTSNKDTHPKPDLTTLRSPSATEQRNPIESSSYTESEESSSFRSSTEDGSTPPIPPRPIPKPGGRLSMRRAQTSRQSDIQSTSYLSMMAKARRVSASNPKLSKGVIVANAPTKRKVLIGPRKPPSPKTSYPQDNSEVTVQHMFEHPEHAWLDVPPETPRRATELSPMSSATSNKSYKTAVSYLYTSDSPERSDDTVVDWTVGLPRQGVPILQITHPSGKRPSKARSKKKSHISLSVSSEFADATNPTASNFDSAVSPINRSPAGSPPKLPPSMPSMRSTEPEVKQKAGPKRKGHVSLSTSSATDSSLITPMSSGSNGPIIQWPSLKKSPRISELNKGLQDPKNHAPPPVPSQEGSIVSATDTVLQGYIDSPSPSSPRAANTSWLDPTIYSERKAPPQSPPKATPIPLLVSTVDLERDSQPHSCACSLTVKSVVEASFGTLRAEITQQFEAQKSWFEELLRAKEEGITTLAEENRWLRGESAKLKKGKEKEKGIGNSKSA